MPTDSPPASGALSGLRHSSAAAFIGPFAVFMVLQQIIQWARSDEEGAPWWLSHPEHWGYPLQALVCLTLVWCWRKHYPRFSWKGTGLAFIMGLIGISLWLLPPLIHTWTGLGSEESLPWLKWLGFQPRLEGFNPHLFGEAASPPLLWTIIGLRFLRLVLAVALVEEIFWRGFLMRWLADPEKGWEQQPIGKYNALPFWLTSLAFALAHLGPDFAVALIYGSLAGWVTIHTRNLWAVVIMHSTANLALGLFIMNTGWWGLW
tara:strand:+ start:902 stop:1684 length:783 start_codon:yes stop_codon:yes gene_type:complete